MQLLATQEFPVCLYANADGNEYNCTATSKGCESENDDIDEEERGERPPRMRCTTRSLRSPVALSHSGRLLRHVFPFSARQHCCIATPHHRTCCFEKDEDEKIIILQWSVMKIGQEASHTSTTLQEPFVSRNH